MGCGVGRGVGSGRCLKAFANTWEGLPMKMVSVPVLIFTTLLSALSSLSVYADCYDHSVQTWEERAVACNNEMAGKKRAFFSLYCGPHKNRVLFRVREKPSFLVTPSCMSEEGPLSYRFGDGKVTARNVCWEEVRYRNRPEVLWFVATLSDPRDYNAFLGGLIHQYFGQSSSRPVSDGAIVTKVLVIGAGFFQAMPLG